MSNFESINYTADSLFLIILMTLYLMSFVYGFFHWTQQQVKTSQTVEPFDAQFFNKHSFKNCCQCRRLCDGKLGIIKHDDVILVAGARH